MFKTTSQIKDSGLLKTPTKKEFQTSNSQTLTRLKTKNDRPSAWLSIGVIIVLLAEPYRAQAQSCATGWYGTYPDC